MLLGLALLYAVARRRRPRLHLSHAFAGLTALIVGVALVTRNFDPRFLTSGVYRSGRIDPEQWSTQFYKDGRTATISAQRIVQSDLLSISTNGKAEGSLQAFWFDECPADGPRRALHGDAATQTLIPLIPLAHVPRIEPRVLTP